MEVLSFREEDKRRARDGDRGADSGGSQTHLSTLPPHPPTPQNSA